MEELLRKVHGSKRLSEQLALISHLCVVASAVVLASTLRAAFADSAASALKLALTYALPFIIVSIIRKTINAPRPYEIYDFYTEPKKNRDGCSFPSRHACSAFVIGTSALFFLPPWTGAVLLVLAALMCAARVLLGIHFVRDVIAGASIGTISALIGMFIFF